MYYLNVSLQIKFYLNIFIIKKYIIKSNYINMINLCILFNYI